ncbi:MAG: DUF4296 domain-containing protein [Flavobacterium sp.]|nr:MAG: DUF4296 domain-containing protein [Flavobacterium sp.]
MMKPIYPFLIIAVLLSGCGSGVEKPNNLVDKDKMVDIFYDLALLDAMRSQKPIVLDSAGVNPEKYIYKKYSIDSVQFAKSNQYYASDIVEYKKMYQEVAKRLGADDKGNITDPNAPQVQ